MLVHCPSCNKHLNVPDSAVGKKARCPGCNNVFEVAVPTAVAVTPIVSKPPPPPAPVADEEAGQPRRRSRANDDDLDEDRTRRSRRRDEDDDDLDGTDDDRPMRRRAGSGSVVQQVATLSKLLKIASFVLIGAFVIGLLNTYLTAASLRNIVQGNFNVRNGPNNINVNLGALTPSPVAAALFFLVGAGLVYGICLAFMFIGANKATQLTSRGLVMTGVIIALVLGTLMALGAVWNLVVMLRGIMVFSQPVTVLVGAGTSAMLLIAGIRGLIIMGQPAVQAAFAANDGGRPHRRRSRRLRGR